jgi:hypothetical protein
VRKKEIIDIIHSLNLNLNGRVVLTEAATGHYMVTPLIAALSGASKVFAYAKNTKYGTTDFVFSQFKKIIKDFLIENITFTDHLTPEIISQADIITNSGHLRPLDQGKLKYVNSKAVISLMYEKWELRNEDIDIDYCRKNNIRLGAINERHKKIDVFSYLGDMALKLIFDSGQCLYNNKFILLCNNDFGPYIAKTLSHVCSALGVIAPLKDKSKYLNLKVDWLSDFPTIKIPENYKDSKAVVFTAYPFNETWIGDDSSPIPANKLKEQLESPFILRFAGDIDAAFAQHAGLQYYPSDVKSGHMGILPSDIGLSPILRLQAGGLKVAECLLNDTDTFEGEKIVEKLF